MVKKIKIGRFRSTLVLRHRWESDQSISNYEIWRMRKEYKLGAWFKINKTVGTVKRGQDSQETAKKTFVSDNLVNTYMIGLDLIVCKMWVDFRFNPVLEL